MDAHWLHIRPRRPFVILGLGIILLAVVVMGWTVVQAVRQGARAPRFIVLAAMMGIGSVCVCWILLWYYPRLVRRAYIQQKSLHVLMWVHVDQSGVQVQSDFVNALMPWSHYLKWKENERIFLLYQTTALYQVFPKRCMDTAEIEVFRGMLSGSVPREG